MGKDCNMYKTPLREQNTKREDKGHSHAELHIELLTYEQKVSKSCTSYRMELLYPHFDSSECLGVMRRDLKACLMGAHPLHLVKLGRRENQA